LGGEHDTRTCVRT